MREGSWFEPLKDLEGKLVGLVSNPPYTPSDDYKLKLLDTNQNLHWTVVVFSIYVKLAVKLVLQIICRFAINRYTISDVKKKEDIQ